MPDDLASWERVAAEVNRRLTELHWNQVDLVRASGVSDTTIREIQGGRGVGSRHRSTLGKLAAALGWSPDSFDLILLGERPRMRDVLDDLAAAVDQAHRRLFDVMARYEIARAEGDVPVEMEEERLRAQSEVAHRQYALMDARAAAERPYDVVMAKFRRLTPEDRKAVEQLIDRLLAE